MTLCSGRGHDCGTARAVHPSVAVAYGKEVNYEQLL